MYPFSQLVQPLISKWSKWAFSLHALGVKSLMLTSLLCQVFCRCIWSLCIHLVTTGISGNLTPISDITVRSQGISHTDLRHYSQIPGNLTQISDITVQGASHTKEISRNHQFCKKGFWWINVKTYYLLLKRSLEYVSFCWRKKCSYFCKALKGIYFSFNWFELMENLTSAVWRQCSQD